MAKKSGRALKKITKLLERYVTQHGHLMEWIEKAAQRAITAAGERSDGGRAAADLHQRLDEMESRSAERQRADQQFRVELLVELRRHNELVAAALAHALPARPAANAPAPGPARGEGMKALEATKPSGAAKSPEAAKPSATKPRDDAQPAAPKKPKPGAKPAR